MKFLNKKKKYRETWKTSPPPPIHQMKDAKKWCQQNVSKGKFYFHYTNTRWWFEFEDDALVFALIWGSGSR